MVPIPLAVGATGAIPADPRLRPEVAVEEEQGKGKVPMAAAVVGEEDRGRHHLHPHPCLILKLELSADETVEGISGGTVARHQHPSLHRLPRVGAETGNDQGDRTLLRGPAHRHQMMMAKLSQGDAGPERRRLKREKRRMR